MGYYKGTYLRNAVRRLRLEQVIEMLEAGKSDIAVVVDEPDEVPKARLVIYSLLHDMRLKEAYRVTARGNIIFLRAVAKPRVYVVDIDNVNAELEAANEQATEEPDVMEILAGEAETRD